jgi:hypothetical protein
VDDVSAISRLKYRYLRTLDTKSWDDFADTMIPEATATYSEYLQFESREAFIAFMRNTLFRRSVQNPAYEQMSGYASQYLERQRGGGSAQAQAQTTSRFWEDFEPYGIADANRFELLFLGTQRREGL